MVSPLENKPKILEKIGLFIVLFNLIENRLGLEFYWTINQSDKKKAPILDFLSSQKFSKKLDILKFVIGNNIYLKIKEVNEFRQFIAHGMFGENPSSGEMSITKQKLNTRKYKSKNLSGDILDKYIKKERIVLELLYKLILKRIPNRT